MFEAIAVVTVGLPIFSENIVVCALATFILTNKAIKQKMLNSFLEAKDLILA